MSVQELLYQFTWFIFVESDLLCLSQVPTLNICLGCLMLLDCGFPCDGTVAYLDLQQIWNNILIGDEMYLVDSEAALTMDFWLSIDNISNTLDLI